MKFTSIYFKASAKIFEVYLKYTYNERDIRSLLQYISKRVQKYSRFTSNINITSEIYEVYFSIFQSECKNIRSLVFIR